MIGSPDDPVSAVPGDAQGAGDTSGPGETQGSGETQVPIGVDWNPFASSAVARVPEFTDDLDRDDDTITIRTAAIREVLGYLDQYLRPQGFEPESRTGTVVAVVGDYGTGKTHLAVEMLRHARQIRGKNVHVIYIDAQPDTFVPLYRRFLEHLKEGDVVNQVKDYYTDVVADELMKSELTTVFAEHLRDGQLDADHVVAELGLPDNLLVQELRRRLYRVTRNESFATALTLLRRPAFSSAVWNWFSGRGPEPILRERGITDTLDSEEGALEAMGVFALLYGHRDHRLVLVIDELERVLCSANRPDDTAMAAFKKLLSVLSEAGAFLALVGLPDFLGDMPPDVRARIGQRIDMTALTADDTREFIRRAQERAGRGAQLAPFTSESVDYMVQLADQTPRKILRLCYHIFHRATIDRVAVTDELVREVALAHTSILSADSVRDHISKALVEQGRRYTPNYLIDRTTPARVDFWVYNEGDRTIGSGIVVTESVIREQEVEELTRRALSIRGATHEVEALLVVNGHVSQEMSARLEAAFGRAPLVYRQLSFTTQLDALLNDMMTRTDSGGRDALAVIRERVERMNRQQSSTYQFIEQIAADMDRWRSTSEKRFDSLRGTSGGCSRRCAAKARARS